MWDFFTGFTTAAAITIGSAQINNLFGLKAPSNNLIPAWKHFFTHLNSIGWNDASLGISTLIFLLAMKVSFKARFDFYNIK